MRALPLQRVYGELAFFLNARVRQVKFIDRTFNCVKDRALNIWRFLKESDNGITNFHFEISADLLDEEAIRLLAGVREGMFQFEIGVQSTNISVLRKIKRHTNLPGLTKNVSMLREPANVRLHLDLIAGLPGEGYTSFKQSFNDVYAMKPDILQLGFLKALKGTGLRNNAPDYGLVYDDCPPYEVLKTNEMTFDEISKLKDIETLVDGFYNMGLAPLTLNYLTGTGAFEFYEKFAEFWRYKGYYSSMPSKMGMYAALYEYCLQTGAAEAGLILDFVKFDLLLRENEKNPPEWLVPRPSSEMRALYGIYRKTMGADAFNIQAFEYDIAGWACGTPIKRRNIILFRYKNGKGRGTFCEITGRD